MDYDVHKDCIITAVAEEGRKGEVRESGALSNDLHALEKWIGRLDDELRYLRSLQKRRSPLLQYLVQAITQAVE